ncbi:MAG: glycosyltransferase family 2 protein [Pirellulaceae bacterium]|nr:glycosyltransferase family 2 protein [Pirellulaceae bacterium]
MLEVLNYVVPSLLMALIIGQGVYVALYLRMRRRENLVTDSNFLPPASVILCLRGRDPTLLRCLKAIEAQDYPDFELTVVFDSTDDPAYQVVEAFRERTAIKIRTLVIPQYSGQCGMKCEALICAIENLDPRHEVVALIDADSIAAPNWLRVMVGPLADTSVGAVTGDRWFEPNHEFASITRAVWNAAAIVQMNLYRIAWGGSLAMRSDTIQRLGILDVWRKTFCEDTVLVDLFRRENLTVVRPRQAVVFNEESIAWKNLHFWIARQLLTVRLHNDKWPFVFGHGLLVGLTLLMCFLLMIVDLSIGKLAVAAGVASTTLLAELINFGLVALIARENVSILREQGQIVGESAIRRQWWRWLLAIPLTQITHFLSTLRAVRMPYVIWRGIEYKVTKDRVELVRYRTFSDRNVQAPDDASLQ